MSKILDQEITKMQRLMNYGVAENASRPANGSIERMAKAADGKTYGIIHEGTKYYIKAAPAKNSQVLAEDFDYIGGFNNRKANEYTSYAKASKNFDLKMMNISESYNTRYDDREYKDIQPAEWQINETREMRSEINRFNDLTNKVNNIINEEYSKNGFKPNTGIGNVGSGDPYNDAAPSYSGDKDFKKTSSDHKKKYPYETDAKSYGDRYRKGNKPSGSKGAFEDYDNTDVDSKDMPGEAVASQKGKKAGKFVGVHEGRKPRNIKITEEQVLAWNRKLNPDYVDNSHGTEIGDGSPYDDDVDTRGYNRIHEAECDHIACMGNDAVHNRDTVNYSDPGVGEIGDGDPYGENVDEGYVFEVEMDDDFSGVDDSVSEGALKDLWHKWGDEIDRIDSNPTAWADDEEEDDNPEDELPEDEEDFEDEDYEDDDFEDDEFDEDHPDMSEPTSHYDSQRDFDFDQSLDDMDDEEFEEAYRRNGRRLSEVELHDFGRHPAYRKHPMTWKNDRGDTRWGRDWNDESTKGEEPFGKKIGKSSPYDDVIGDAVRDAIHKIAKKKD